MRVALACVLLFGCDQLWNIDHVTPRDAAVDTADAVSTCPTDYTFNLATQSYYKQVFTPATWDFARATCKNESNDPALHTHLAVINDKAEYDTLFMFPGVVANSGWIGAFDSDLQDGVATYRWVTEDPKAKLFWGGAGTQPDQPDVQGCARLWVPDGMDNAECGINYQYICECDRFVDNGT